MIISKWFLLVLTGFFVLICYCASSPPLEEGKDISGIFTTELVRSLLDGNSHVQNNNRIVSELTKRNNEAIPLLMEAIQDKKFAGRGYAAWALAVILSQTGNRNDDAIRSLVEALDDEDGYVRMLTVSGLNQVNDKRTIYAIIVNFDERYLNFSRTLKTLTGKTFSSKKDAVKWWEKNHARYPEQIIPVGYPSLSNGSLYTSVTADKEIYQQSEPVIITCVIKNLSGKAIKVEEPHLTSCAIKYDGGSYAYQWAPETKPKILLKPGEEWRKSGEIELRSVIGTYEIELYGIRDKRITYSEKIPVKVITATDETVHKEKVYRLLDKLDKTYYDQSVSGSSIDTKLSCWSRAQQDLAEMGNLSVEILRSTLNSHQNPVIRGKIAVVLGRLKSKESLPELHQALKDHVSAVRKAVIDALGSIKDPASKKELIAMLKDEDSGVRWRTIVALEKYPSSEEVKVLFIDIMSTDTDSWVRLHAAQALAKQYKSTKAVPVLIEFLKSAKDDSACWIIKDLECVTDLNFGPVPPFYAFCCGDSEEAQKELEQTINKWLLWWKEEGKKKYSE